MLALYDMDRTLTGVASWPWWLAFWVRHEAPWRALLLPLLPLLLLGYALRLLDRGGLKAAMQRLFMGSAVQESRVAARAEAFARHFGAAHELAPALAQLAADRDAGLEPVLVTASPHYYVEALARRWGIATVIATLNRREGQLILPALATPNCYGPEKVARLNAHFGPGALPVARAYSDHASDLPMLELAREAVAANPTPKLAAIAAARGWPIRHWR